MAAAGEAEGRAEKEQADAAGADAQPTVITSAGPEAPKLDLAGMLSAAGPCDARPLLSETPGRAGRRWSAALRSTCEGLPPAAAGSPRLV